MLDKFLRLVDASRKITVAIALIEFLTHFGAFLKQHRRKRLVDGVPLLGGAKDRLQPIVLSRFWPVPETLMQ